MMCRLISLLLAALVSTTAPAATLFVVNKSDDTVSAIDVPSGELVANVSTGKGPHEIAVSPDGKTAVATNYGTAENRGNSLTVIDVEAGSLKATILLRNHIAPHGIKWLPDSRHVAVTTEGSQEILVVDVPGRQVKSVVRTDQEISHMVALAPDGRRAYVANIGSDTVSVIDLNLGLLLQNLSTSAEPEGIAVTPDGSEIWVSNRDADTVMVFNATTLAMEVEFGAGETPIRIEMTPDGRHALVTNAGSNELWVFDVENRSEVARIAVGEAPIGLLIDPDGKRAYVANVDADYISVIDTSTWEVVGRLEAGSAPDGLGFSVVTIGR